MVMGVGHRWSTRNLPGFRPLEQTDSASPSTHHMPAAPLLRVGPLFPPPCWNFDWLFIVVVLFLLLQVLFWFCLLRWGAEPRVSCMLNKSSLTGMHPSRLWPNYVC